jgi:hypothetical protein
LRSSVALHHEWPTGGDHSKNRVEHGFWCAKKLCLVVLVWSISLQTWILIFNIAWIRNCGRINRTKDELQKTRLPPGIPRWE